MKDTDLRIEALYFLLAILSVVSVVWHGVRLSQEDAPDSANRETYVDTRVKNEGEKGLFAVRIEQEGETVCEATTFLAAGEERNVTITCPGLEDTDYRIAADRQ